MGAGGGVGLPRQSCHVLRVCRDDLFPTLDRLKDMDKWEPAKIQDIIHAAQEFAANYLTLVGAHCQHWRGSEPVVSLPCQRACVQLQAPLPQWRRRHGSLS